MSARRMDGESGYEQVSPEDFLEAEGIEYRDTSGSRGRQHNIKECPKCGGRDWKVYLSVETGFGNCFHGSCETRFNLWTFAKAALGTDDSKVVGQKFDEIAKTIGWRPKVKRVAAPPPITGTIKLPPSYALPKHDGSNHPYLEARGITASLCQQFGLRVCEDGGFAYQDEEGKPRLQVFSGRILIPVFDLDNTPVTFQGRDITGVSDRKYLFPKRLPATARFLYNGNRAYAEAWSHAVLGEGAFDVIATQAAIDQDRGLVGMGAIGSFGKSLTLDADPSGHTQLQALIALKARGLKTITILWDGEKKALVSALKAARRLVRHGFAVRVGFLPKGRDPAEVAPETVRKAIRTALPYSRSLEVKVTLRNPYA